MKASIVGISAVFGLVGAETPEDRIVAALGGKPDFLWGSATASYQVEGAWDRDGRQKSIWDTFSQTPGHVFENETGNVADDFYDKYPEDINLLKSLGFNSFRMSISWSRIYPKGEDGVHRANPLGVRFYKNVIGKLISSGITPLVTIFHWDLPDDLDWLDEPVVDAFVDFSDFLFSTFPEVKHWLTFNEPWTFCLQGYRDGIFAPGIKSKYKQYTCSHNVLRSHARAVSIYRQKYKAAAQGKIGITLNYDFAFPWNASSPEDQAATQLHHDFNLGWWADPVYLTGDYPASMRRILGANLPEFTAAEKLSLKGSSDYYGLNTYSGMYIKANGTFYTELRVGPDGKDIGERADSPWLYVVPREMKAHLEYVNDRYKPQEIMITENGCDVPGENDMSMSDALNDTFRIKYYESYLDNVAAAVRESKVPVTGYFAWSLLDNFEWADGYRFRFGLTYVNYTTQQRYAKSSAYWFQKLIARMDKPEDSFASRRLFV